MTPDDINITDITPIGYQGAAQHTYTPACDGFHEPGQCPGADRIPAAGCHASDTDGATP